MFLGPDGKPVGNKSSEGGLAVATPGMVAGLYEIHKKWGKLSWSKVINPAIRLAKEGFPVSPAVAKGIEKSKDILAKDSYLKNIFMPNGVPLKAGEKLVQPDLAKTLQLLAVQGKKGFYQGKLAQKITETIKKWGGIVDMKDLAAYKVLYRDPIRIAYDDYVIFSAPPPSAGGVLLSEWINVLQPLSLKNLALTPTSYLHILSQAMKQGYADRSVYMGDPDFFKEDFNKLMSQDYANQVRQNLNLQRNKPSSEIYPGLKPQEPKTHGTTQLSIIDNKGNAISATLSINNTFGAYIGVPGTGMVLNNTMDDFSIKPGEQNLYGLTGNEGNAIEPKKRPVSSMMPTIVVKGEDATPVLALGAAGGSRIISSVAQVLIGTLTLYNGDLKKALFAPRIHHQWIPDKLEMEEGGFSESVRQGLVSRGHELSKPPYFARVEGVNCEPDGSLHAVFDPRHEGGAEAQ
jgi:gamma-glutamyltranspeptidase/glutathione hydrolase